MRREARECVVALAGELALHNVTGSWGGRPRDGERGCWRLALAMAPLGSDAAPWEHPVEMHINGRCTRIVRLEAQHGQDVP